ncbi:hypothetical protein CC_0546 [Caulobacter vibrioides CB15]|uniref:Uncharacterized protein n=1 Tax=Caulobacter vibrioides (strain ATCC 19089 / CIP 103742 / CB 15) TaxID=190650 RepID=Q9AAQ0_CAUVC|nr:hypothetical protein CC_0546 [Caulobacter vibrioides CB15]
MTGSRRPDRAGAFRSSTRLLRVTPVDQALRQPGRDLDAMGEVDMVVLRGDAGQRRIEDEVDPSIAQRQSQRLVRALDQRLDLLSREVADIFDDQTRRACARGGLRIGELVAAGRADGLEARDHQPQRGLFQGRADEGLERHPFAVDQSRRRVLEEDPQKPVGAAGLDRLVQGQRQSPGLIAHRRLGRGVAGAHAEGDVLGGELKARVEGLLADRAQQVLLRLIEADADQDVSRPIAVQHRLQQRRRERQARRAGRRVHAQHPQAPDPRARARSLGQALEEEVTANDQRAPQIIGERPQEARCDIGPHLGHERFVKAGQRHQPASGRPTSLVNADQLVMGVEAGRARGPAVAVAVMLDAGLNAVDGRHMAHPPASGVTVREVQHEQAGPSAQRRRRVRHAQELEAHAFGAAELQQGDVMPVGERRVIGRKVAGELLGRAGRQIALHVADAVSEAVRQDHADLLADGIHRVGGPAGDHMPGGENEAGPDQAARPADVVAPHDAAGRLADALQGAGVLDPLILGRGFGFQNRTARDSARGERQRIGLQQLAVLELQGQNPFDRHAMELRHGLGGLQGHGRLIAELEGQQRLFRAHRVGPDGGFDVLFADHRAPQVRD